MKRIWIVGAIVLFLALLYFFIDPSSGILPECPFYRVTGLFCPGCGSQRAMHALLHGRLGVSLGLNPLLVAGLLFTVAEAGLLLAQRNGGRVRTLTQRRIVPYVVLVIILVFWVFRNIPVSPFSCLAP